jgi:ParB family transcriptional regulator, chromosome partitioning protein
MQTQDNTIFVPYGKLRHSSRNVRERDEQYNEKLLPLAASIEAFGVLQNLIGTEHGRSKQVHYEVEAGHRRLDALGVLFERGAISKRTLIPLTLVPLNDAVAISLAENTQREQIHKGDEILAYKRMIDDGRSIEQVAKEFHVEAIVVQRRLKLANVGARFLTMFRADEIGLDVLMALAITDDHERQSKVWDALPQYQRDARSVRAALTKEKIDIKRNPVALYIGAKVYEEAGGVVERDLFREQDDGFMLDAALLHQLAQVKLTKRADAVRKEGFSWVETRLQMDTADRSAFGQVGTIAREPTKKEVKQIEKLTEKITALEAVEDLDDEAFDELHTLRDELTDLEETLVVPDPEQQSIAGAIVTIGQDGKAEVLRGLIRPEDKRLIKAVAKKKKKDAAQSGAGSATSEDESELSARLTLRLTAQMTAGLQVATARNPQVALALTVFRLVRGRTDALHLHLTDANLRMHDEGIEQSSALKEMQSIRDKALDQVPPDDFGWFLQQPVERLLEILAVCIAPAIDAVTNSATVSNEVAALARAVKLDMADWWQPTADTYLRYVSKPQIIASVNEGVSQEAATEVSKAKTKALMVTMAQTQLAGRRWLPSIMRN